MSDPLPRLAVSKARLKGEDPDSEESERYSYQLTKLPGLMALSYHIASSKVRRIQLSNTSGLGRPSANNQALSTLLLKVVQSKHIIKKRKSKKRASSGLSFHHYYIIFLTQDFRSPPGPGAGHFFVDFFV